MYQTYYYSDKVNSLQQTMFLIQRTNSAGVQDDIDFLLKSQHLLLTYELCGPHKYSLGVGTFYVTRTTHKVEGDFYLSGLFVSDNNTFRVFLLHNKIVWLVCFMYSIYNKSFQDKTCFLFKIVYFTLFLHRCYWNNFFNLNSQLTFFSKLNSNNIIVNIYCDNCMLLCKRRFKFIHTFHLTPIKVLPVKNE